MAWQIPRESDYTVPRPDCPHPEWWTSENNMATERELDELVAAFVRAVQPEFVLEIGSHYGQGAELIGKALQQNGHGKCVSLEIDEPLSNSARWRTQAVKDVVEIVTANSLEYIPPVPVDLLYVDGSPNRVMDVEHFVPYCRPGTIILIHDMAHQNYAIQLPRIYELCGPNHVFVNSPRGMAIIELPK